jgi:anti-sigma factor RsiW
MWRAMGHPIRFGRDHRFTVIHASGYLDGELEVDAARRGYDHAHICPKCHEMLDSLRRTISGLRGLRGSSRASVVPDVLDALRSDDEQRTS